MASFRVFRNSEIGPEIRSEWQRVFETDPTARWSQSPDWAESYQHVYGGSFELWTEWDQGQMQAAVPMHRSGTVYAAAASDSAAPVLAHPVAGRCLFDQSRAHVTRWMAVTADSPWTAILPVSAQVDAEINLQMDLVGDFDGYVQSLSKSLRYDVRRRNQFEIRASTPATVEQDLDILLRLHRDRWRKRGLPGLFFGRRGDFFRRWVTRGVQLGKVELLVAESAGDAVGAACFMVHGGRTSFYQSGVLPVAGSPGTALVAEAIARAYRRQDQIFDFLRGDEPYKRRWRPNVESSTGRYLLVGSDVNEWSIQRWRNAWWKLDATAYRKLRLRFEGKGLYG
jgi:CelD/BcsL family acetyltransferase involved in cellulose biosynthesis